MKLLTIILLAFSCWSGGIVFREILTDGFSFARLVALAFFAAVSVLCSAVLLVREP